jgi:cell division protein FtsB
MKVNLGIWEKLTRFVIFLLFFSGIVAVAVWYLPLIQQNERMRKEVLRLDSEIQVEQETQSRLRAEIDALKYDPRTVERLAREKLGYARPGEIVITFDQPAASGTAPRRPTGALTR